MMTRKIRSSGPEGTPAHVEVSARLASLHGQDPSWLKLQIALESEQTREEDRAAPSSKEIEDLAMKFISGRGPAVPDKRSARLRDVRLAREALREAIAISEREYVAAANSDAANAYARLREELSALTRERATTVLALQAINRRWAAMAMVIRGKAHAFPLPCEVPVSPHILLGPGLEASGPTADFIRRVIEAGILTPGEVARLRGDEKGRVK